MGRTPEAFEGAVATPDGRCWRDGTCNAGFGTSGSGDVLAAVVTGLLARGAEPDHVAVSGLLYARVCLLHPVVTAGQVRLRDEVVVG